MRIVVALGGNALLRRGERLDASIQLTHIHAAAAVLAPLANAHDLLICHGNGPQVGMLAMESENDPDLTRSYPLDDLVAETQGMIGYWLTQSLHNAGVHKPILSVITQTQVDPTDAAFRAPTKFVGTGYSRDRARELAEQRGWSIRSDGGRWRRVVPSPDPRRVIEQDSIAYLLDAGTVVVCGGGGGAPVTADLQGRLGGVDAVIDKDYVAALLGIAVHADKLLVLTDVTAVMRDFGTPQAAPLRHLDLDELATMQFPAGSMQPKIEACRRFVSATGHPASIGALTDAAALLVGTAGTTITAATSDTDRVANTTGEVRIRMNPDARGLTFVDGSWWPRSTDLATELPGLVAALSDRLGPVTMVGYHLDAWPQAPSRIQIDGDSVDLRSFASDEPATVILIDDGGRSVTLSTIPPGATEQRAREDMEVAAAAIVAPPAVNVEFAAAISRSLAEVAAQLARHEGRNDTDRDHDIKRWCDEAAGQFVNAPIQAFVPILVEHIVRNRMDAPSTTPR
jgi:carbamate kinase